MPIKRALRPASAPASATTMRWISSYIGTLRCSMSSKTSAVLPSKAKSLACACGVAKMVSRVIVVSLLSQPDHVDEPADALAIALVGMFDQTISFVVDGGPSLQVRR